MSCCTPRCAHLDKCNHTHGRCSRHKSAPLRLGRCRGSHGSGTPVHYALPEARPDVRVQNRHDPHPTSIAFCKTCDFNQACEFKEAEAHYEYHSAPQSMLSNYYEQVTATALSRMGMCNSLTSMVLLHLCKHTPHTICPPWPRPCAAHRAPTANPNWRT